MLRARATVVSAGVIVAALGGCALFTDLQGFDCGADGCVEPTDGGDADAEASVAAEGGGDDGGSDGDAGPDGGRCPSGRGPEMIVAGSFCIDSTEVTVAQYAKFVDDPNKPGSPPAICASVTNHTPICLYDPIGLAKQPVRCVSWCNAWSFCRWAGKRLCGKIGGGILTPAASTDPKASQWMAACTHDGQREYAYGAAFDSMACMTGVSDPADVGSKTTCEGGYPGLFDMNGNLEEWEDACEPAPGGGGGVRCTKRGGDYAQGPTACSNSIVEDVFEDNVDTGFRCCAD